MAEPILIRVAHGDRRAVAECLDLYGGLVWSLARRFLGDSPDAEDATQEIFLDLWAHAGRFDPARSSEATFVAMIARRRLIDAARRSARRPRPVPLADDPASTRDDPQIVAEGRDDATRAARALSDLPEGQQRVLGLAVTEGLTYEEIARRTGLPLGTVKTNARRGLMRLRDVLADDRQGVRS